MHMNRFPIAPNQYLSFSQNPIFQFQSKSEQGIADYFQFQPKSELGISEISVLGQNLRGGKGRQHFLGRVAELRREVGG